MDDQIAFSNDTVEQQLRYYWSQWPSVSGLVMLAVLGLLLYLVIRFDRAKWGILTLAIYMATVGFSTNRYMENNIAPPLAQIRSLFRPITIALIALLIIPTLRAARGARSKLFRPAIWSLFALQLTMSARYVLGTELTRGTIGAVIFGWLFLIFGFGISLWLQTLEDVWSALRSIVAAGVLIVLATSYQLVIDRSQIIAQARLYGTTNNPQTLGSVMALFIPVACYLFVRQGEGKAWRLVYALFIGIGSVFLVWTGSRLSVLMIALGLLLLFRIRLGRLVPVLLAGGSVAYILLSLIEGPGAAVSHLMSTENTRAQPWAELWALFMANPLLGTGSHTLGFAENSYLSAAAGLGVFGLIPMFFLLAFMWKDLWDLTRLRRALGDHALLVDLLISGLVTILVAAMFESYLLGMITAYMFMIYILFDISAFLLDPAWAAAPQPAAKEADVVEYAEFEIPWDSNAALAGGDGTSGSGDWYAGRHIPEYSPN